jgi:hypothetical protein
MISSIEINQGALRNEPDLLEMNKSVTDECVLDGGWGNPLVLESLRALSTAIILSPPHQ